jgi:hypothetical protein
VFVRSNKKWRENPNHVQMIKDHPDQEGVVCLFFQYDDQVAVIGSAEDIAKQIQLSKEKNKKQK